MELYATAYNSTKIESLILSSLLDEHSNPPHNRPQFGKDLKDLNGEKPKFRVLVQVTPIED